MKNKTPITASIKDFINSKDIRALSASSQAMYRYALASFRQFCYRETVGDIDLYSVETFCGILLTNKKSISTIKQYLTIVKMYLKWAGNPIEYSFKAPAGAKKKQQLKQIERWFTEKEVASILEYRSQNGTALRNQIMVRLLFETGARIQEIACIAWKDVSLMDRTVWLRTSKTVPRPAFISRETNSLLSRYQNTIEFNFTGDDDEAEWEKNLFPNVAQCKKVFTDMLVELGLKNGADGRGPHTCRHAFCSRMHYIGKMSVDDIAILVGDTASTVRDVYLHIPENILKEKYDTAWHFIDSFAKKEN